MAEFKSKWARWDANTASQVGAKSAKSPFAPPSDTSGTEATSTFPEIEALKLVSDDDLAMAVAAIIIINAKAKC